MNSYIEKLNSDIDLFEYVQKMSIKTLEELINFTSDKYFNDNEVISDTVFDILIDFVRAKDPKNKLLKKIGSSVKLKEKEKLPYSLFSMDKVKPPSKKLDSYTKKYNGPYILSDKLDGVSALLVYDNNNNVNFYTRGTSHEGQNITKLLKYIKNIPSYDKMEKLCTKHKVKGKDNLIAFRGELIMTKETFDKNWSEKMKNSRNTVAGLVNSKNINPSLARDTQFVVYEVVDPILSILDQFDSIKKFKFNIVNFKKINNLTFDSLSNFLLERKKESKYLIDGIIVTNNDKHTRPKNKNPDYAFAFKTILDDQKGVTKVVNIEWNQSKHGYLIPTIIIEPLKIGGVTIKRVTGNNAKFVIDNKIGKDAVVEVIRSGDVIPKIDNIIKIGKVNMPTIKWHWNKTGIDIIADNLNCKDIHIKNIYNFFVTLETKGLGERMIEKLYDNGLNTIKKIITVKKNKLLEIETIKEKLAQNILNSIKKSIENTTLSKIMVASNKLGIGMGIKRMESIINTYPNLLKEYTKWSKDTFINKIKEIEGWEDKTSTLFVENFNKFIIFYNDIKQYLKFKTISKKNTGKYNGKKIVLSGFRDKELQEYLENEGAIITTSVSKHTYLVIVKDLESSSSKIEKAKSFNIPIKLKTHILL